METTQSKAPQADLAKRIYVELVARNAVFDADGVKMTAPAASLVSLSMKLAEAFAEVEEQASTTKKPASTFDFEKADIAAWTK